MDVKTLPILFKGPMVRAILSGHKTQTRRVVKPQPTGFIGGPGTMMPEGMTAPILPINDDAGPYGSIIQCPYGRPGDRLWVRETWRTAKSLDNKSPSAIGDMCIDAGYKKPWAPLAYDADNHYNSEWIGFELSGNAEPGKLRPSIHMPRWASRITLEVTGIRVERLGDISDEDSLAEGIYPTKTGLYPGSAKAEYRKLWESINGHGSWEANPWVWVIEFRRIS